MPDYADLARLPADARSRVARGLLALRASLDAEIPARTIDGTVLVATWNLREFDTGRFGSRTEEAFRFIAEILSRFDVVAIQEVADDLSALLRLEQLLGGTWRHLVTDTSLGSAGNRERMAFVYDVRKLDFSGLAGEVVIPDKAGASVLQLARTPFLCGFRAGATCFALCTVHLYYGQGARDPRRTQEIRALAALLAGKAGRPDSPTENLVLLGDFNVFNTDDAVLTTLESAGFGVPPEIQPLGGSSLDRSRHYDQIAVLAREGRFATTGRAGVFDWSRAVFRREDAATWAHACGRYDYAQWRTHQMSDHLPLWVEVKTDFAARMLEGG